MNLTESEIGLPRDFFFSLPYFCAIKETERSNVERAVVKEERKSNKRYIL